MIPKFEVFVHLLGSQKIPVAAMLDQPLPGKVTLPHGHCSSLVTICCRLLKLFERLVQFADETVMFCLEKMNLYIVGMPVSDRLRRDSQNESKRRI